MYIFFFKRKDIRHQSKLKTQHIRKRADPPAPKQQVEESAAQK